MPRTSTVPISRRATSGVAPPAAVAVEAVIRRIRSTPVWVLLVETFIGLGWMRAATEKVLDGDWWSGAVIADFLDEHEATRLPWFEPFAEAVVEPSLPLVAAIVVTVQAVLGLALLTGVGRKVALIGGMSLNLVFVAAGAVNPSVFYLLAQMAVLLWMLESRWDRSAERTSFGLMATGWLLAIVSLPFVSTIDPVAVIDDAAVMLATFGGLVAATCFVLIDRQRWTRATGRP